MTVIKPIMLFLLIRNPQKKHKMKALYILLLLPSLTFAQIDSTRLSLPVKDGKVVYELIIEQPTLNKLTLYGASKKWISDTFVNAKAVIQSEDANSGQIIGKLYNGLEVFKNDKSIIGRKFHTQCNVQIDVKDGKCRIRFYNIIWLYPTMEMVSFTKPMEDFMNESDAREYSKWYNKQSVNAQYYALIDSYRNAIIKAQNDNF